MQVEIERGPLANAPVFMGTHVFLYEQKGAVMDGGINLVVI